MADDLFKRLRERESSPQKTTQYSFGAGGDSPFSRRPSPSTTSKPSTRPSNPLTPKRTDDFDREPAYLPPAEVREGRVYEWEPPSRRERIKDLGLRILEAAIAAGAYAIGEEIAYFFRKRRFYTREEEDRRRGR